MRSRFPTLLLGLLLFACSIFSVSAASIKYHPDKKQHYVQCLEHLPNVVFSNNVDVLISDLFFIENIKSEFGKPLLLSVNDSENNGYSKAPDKYIAYKLLQKNYIFYHKTLHYINGTAGGTKKTLLAITDKRVTSDFKIGWYQVSSRVV